MFVQLNNRVQKQKHSHFRTSDDVQQFSKGNMVQREADSPVTVTHRHQGELIAKFKDRRRPSHEFGKSSASGFVYSLFMEDTPEGMYVYLIYWSTMFVTDK